MIKEPSEEPERFIDRIKCALIGTKRNLEDPSIFHKIALIPVLAWIGLGSGVSSSSYGPSIPDLSINLEISIRSLTQVQILSGAAWYD